MNNKEKYMLFVSSYLQLMRKDQTSGDMYILLLEAQEFLNENYRHDPEELAFKFVVWKVGLSQRPVL